MYDGKNNSFIILLFFIVLIFSNYYALFYNSFLSTNSIAVSGACAK